MEALLLSTEHGPWEGPWWGGLLFVLSIGLLLALLLFKFWWFAPRGWRRYAGDSSDDILRRRLARGEITEEEYRRLRNVLAE